MKVLQPNNCSPIMTRLSQVQPREMAWLWPGRIPLGAISLLVGKPGEGKSFLTTAMAGHVTRGCNWPDGARCPKGSVLFITCEDSLSEVMVHRLGAHFANMENVYHFSRVRRLMSGKATERLFTLNDADATVAMQEAVDQMPDCRMIVIDPIGSFLGARTDANSDNEVRSILAPIALLAEKNSLCVLVVAHRRKKAGGGADEMAIGSRAFTGIARTTFHVSRDSQNKDRRLLTPGKSNVASKGHGMAFVITGTPPSVQWEAGKVEMDADDALRQELTTDFSRDKSKLEEAEEWLMSKLQDRAVSISKIMHDCKKAGVTNPTLYRACKALKIVRERNPVTQEFQWRLPAAEKADLLESLDELM